jgi:hypothetical protein
MAGLFFLALAPAAASAQQLAIHRAEVDEIAGTMRLHPLDAPVKIVAVGLL